MGEGDSFDEEFAIRQAREFVVDRSLGSGFFEAFTDSDEQNESGDHCGRQHGGATQPDEQVNASLAGSKEGRNRCRVQGEAHQKV